MNKNLWMLGVLFYLISFFLGYNSITNKYHAESGTIIVDAHIYRNIAKDGTSAVGEDLRAGRLFIPLVAHAIYRILPANLGSWDGPLLSLLIVNSFFGAALGILIFVFGLNLGLGRQVALISVLLYYSNFAFTYFYMSGLVDVGEALCLLLLVYLLYRNQWKYIPLVAIWGVSLKETFLGSSCAFLLGWILVEIYQTKKINFSRVVPFLLYASLGFIIFTATKSYSNGHLMFPWEYVHKIPFNDTYKAATPAKLLDHVIRFLYVFIWLLPLGIPKLKVFPAEWLAGSLASALFMASLYLWIGADGSSMARYMFTIVGPILCMSASLYLNETILKTSAEFFYAKQSAKKHNK